MTARLGCLLITAAALAACGSDALLDEGAPQLLATRSTTFGAEGGEAALSGVFGVAVAADGSVYLSEPQFARVVAFNADGTFARVVGERGNGPGEFGIPGGLSWRGDSLAVSDFQRGIHLFAPEGDFARLVSFSFSDGSSSFGVNPMFPMPDGSIAAFAPSSSTDITEGRVTHERWLKTSREGTILDTLAVLAVDGRLISVSYQDRTRTGGHPLAWSPLLAVPPNGASMVVLDRPVATEPGSATYRVLRLGLDGDTLIAASRAYTPIAVGSAQIDSIARATAEGWAALMGATAPALAAEIVDQVTWPSYLPPVTEILAGSDGSLWVRRETMGAPMARWEVLAEDLTPIGRLDLPLDLELKVVARDHFYAVELDDFDVPTVVRYEVGVR